MPVSADEADPDLVEEDEEDIDLNVIIRRMIISVVGIVVVVMGSLIIFREPLTRFSGYFVETLGGFGVALGFFLPDAFTLPLPNDAFSAFARIGTARLPFWEVVAWASMGTVLGGLVGFFIGRSLQNTGWFKRLMAKRGREVTALSERYGVFALVLAALTPLPYSIACWASGASGMKLTTFIAVSFLRIPRVAFYLWLIELGMISVT